MRIVGVDPGNTTAIACLEDNKLLGTLLVKLPPSTVKKVKTPLYKRIHSYYQDFIAMLRMYEPELVCLEEPYIPHRTAAKSMDMKLAIIQLACAEAEVTEVKLLNPSVIKKKISGHGKTDKQDIAAMVQASLDNPNAVDELIEGKRWDETDAISIAIAGRDI